MRYFIALLLFLPAALSAQVSVRTGDHPSFTRIVFTIPAGIAWDVQHVGETVTISMPDAGGIDLDGFFARIQRTRIAAATVAGSDIRLQLNCACEVDSFLWRSDGLVVDVIETESDQGTPAQSDATQPPDSTSGMASVASNNTDPVLPLMVDSDNEEPVWPSIQGGDSISERDAETDAATERADLIRDALIDDIARAAAQGLVTLPEGMESQSRSTDSDMIRRLEDALARIEGTPGLTFRTSADGFSADLAGNEVTLMPQCDGGDRYDLSAWGDERPFAAQLSARRLALVSELGSSRKSDVDALAKTYLFFGFGREAIDTLRTDGTMDRDRVALTRIARILDGEPTVFPAAAELVGCDTAAALWAFLATETAEKPNRNAVLQTFRRLPENLQLHLAPRLAERFVTVADTDAAAIVLNPSIAVDNRTVESEIAEVAVLSQGANEGDEQIATRLDSIARAPERLEPDTLVALMQSNRRHNLVPSDQLMDLARIMRFEAGDQEIATALGVEEVRSAAAMGRINRAVDVLDVLSLSDARRNVLNDEIAGHALTLLEDLNFLNFAVSNNVALTDATLANDFAKRLLTLGFAQMAAEYVQGPASGPAMSERRYIRAEIALEMEQLDKIDGILAGLNTERANGLRAARDARLDGFTLVESASEQETIAPSLSAWRSGAWSQLTGDADPIISAAATRQLTDNSQLPEQSDAPLADAYQLLEQSSELQLIVSDLSNRFATPD